MLGPLSRNLKSQSSSLTKSISLHRSFSSVTAENETPKDQQQVQKAATTPQILLGEWQGQGSEEEPDLLLRGVVRPGCVLNASLRPNPLRYAQYSSKTDQSIKEESFWINPVGLVKHNTQSLQSSLKAANDESTRVQARLGEKLVVDESFCETLLQTATEGDSSAVHDFVSKFLEENKGRAGVAKIAGAVTIHSNDITATQLQTITDLVLDTLSTQPDVSTADVFGLVATCQSRVGGKEGLRLFNKLLQVNFRFPLYRSHLEIATRPIYDSLLRLAQVGDLDASTVQKTCRDLVEIVQVLRKIAVNRGQHALLLRSEALSHSQQHIQDWQRHMEYITRLRGDTDSAQVYPNPTLPFEQQLLHSKEASLAGTQQPLPSLAVLNALEASNSNIGSSPDRGLELAQQVVVSQASKILSQGTLADSLRLIVQASADNQVLRASLVNLLQDYFDSLEDGLFQELPEVTESFFYCSKTIEDVFFLYGSHVDNHSMTVVVNGNLVLQLADLFTKTSQQGKQIIMQASRNFFDRGVESRGVAYRIVACEADLLLMCNRLNHLLQQTVPFEHFKSENHLLTFVTAQLAANSKNLKALSTLALQASKYIMGSTFQKYNHALAVELLKTNKDANSHQEVLDSVKKLVGVTMLKSLPESDRIELLHADDSKYELDADPMPEGIFWELKGYQRASKVSSTHPEYCKELEGVPAFTILAKGVAPILEGRFEQGLSFLLEHVINEALADSVARIMTLYYLSKTEFDRNPDQGPITLEEQNHLMKEFQEDLEFSLEPSDYKKLYNNLYTNNWKDQEISISAKALLFNFGDFFSNIVSPKVKEQIRPLYKPETTDTQTADSATEPNVVEAPVAAVATDAVEGEETPVKVSPIPVVPEGEGAEEGAEEDGDKPKKPKSLPISRRNYRQLNENQLIVAQKVEAIKSVLLDEDDAPTRQLSANYREVLYGVRNLNNIQEIDQDDEIEMQTVEEYFLKGIGSSPLPAVLKPQIEGYNWICEDMLEIAITQQNTDLLVIAESLCGITQIVLSPQLKTKYTQYKLKMAESEKKAAEYAKSIEKMPLFIDFSFVQRDVNGHKQKAFHPRNKFVMEAHKMFESMLEEDYLKERANTLSRIGKIGH